MNAATTSGGPPKGKPTGGPEGKPKSTGRRVFLIGAAVVGGGLAVGIGYLANQLAENRRFMLPPKEGEASFGAWLTIDKAGLVTVAVPNQEMGQGVMTTIPMLVAEELDADPANVRAVQAPVAAVYANPTMLLDGLPFRPDDHGLVASSMRWTMERMFRLIGVQATGGSSSTRNAWQAAREAGAAARAMLLAAAAENWKVPVAELQIIDGRISHASGKSATFGELAGQAAKLAPPASLQLKKPEQYRLIGRGMLRTDVPAKVDGSAQFGLDVRLPGMKYAAIRHSPTFGGRVTKAALGGAAGAGSPRLVNGGHYVAVIADSYWQARQALNQASIEWDEGANAKVSSAAIFQRYATALDGGDKDALARDFEIRGDLEAGFGSATRQIKAEYRVPFLAHAAMEPLNCTVQIKNGACEIWAGNQAPTLVKWLAAGKAGVDSEKVTVHTPYLGGGFGRRADLDYVVEAVEIARQADGAAVKTVWTREEDMQHDVYRPAVLSRFEAGFDAKSELVAWRNAIAGPSVNFQFISRINPQFASNALPDKTNAEGATFLPYGLPNLQVRHVQIDVPVPVGFWRSVGHSFNAFFAESFIDECAQAAGFDPYQFRRKLLTSASAPAGAARFLKVLDAAAGKAGWDQPLGAVAGKKVGRGIALAESFHSIVAEVAEVEVDGTGGIKVTRVVAAVDCGLAVDPVIVRAQLASGIVFGLTAALYGRIDVENGRVKQTNFGDYPMVTLASAPKIEVEIVNSGAELGGIGEVGTPPIAPAVANAVFAATGKRLRSLPLALN